jgi:hypothetical protein
MQLNELKQIIRASVKQILSEKKNVLKVGEKPDPLHHLSGSKKFSSKKSKNTSKEKNNTENCDTCNDDVEDDVKVFHEKSDDEKHEKLEDFEFDSAGEDNEEESAKPHTPKKPEKEKLQKESRYRLTKLLY